MAELPEAMLETLVRHRFYSSVDWNKCSAVKMIVLESEFVAVLNACVDLFAPELSAAARTALLENVMDEVREYDCLAMSKYKERLNPPKTLRERVSSFASQKLHSMMMPDLNFDAEQMRDQPEAG